MSIEYCFVSTERKTQVAELKSFLEVERDKFLGRLPGFGDSHPLVKEDIEDFAFSLNQCVNSASLQASDQDDHVIGTATGTRFHWNTEAGFRQLGDVEKFLTEHPGYAIEDEYGSLVSLENFKAVLKNISS